MNLTPTHILQLGVIPTQKVKDALTAWLYCRYVPTVVTLTVPTTYVSTTHSDFSCIGVGRESSQGSNNNVLHAIFRSDFLFSGDTRHGF